MKDESIGHTVFKILDELGLTDVRKLVLITSKWESIVGDGLVDVAEPDHLREGVLSVIVAHHSWAQELHMLKPQMIEKINSVVGDTIVKDIRFKVKSRF